MLRISEAATGDESVVLKLEGRIVGPWIDELDNACARLLERGKSLKLDMAEVSYVDRNGIALLLLLKQRAVLLEGCSPFVNQELKEA
jgi:ABC-type transporter Mla MlaB component